MLKRSTILTLSLVLATALLAGCSGMDVDSRPYEKNEASNTWGRGINDEPQDTIFGKGGLFGSGKSSEDVGGGTGLNVNAYLWRASLDTVAFMPLSSADPFGGVIITDWHSPQANPGERFKVNVFILGRELRADAVKASVFRQVRDASGAWVDTPVADSVATEFENAVLTRARQLRIAAAAR
ncbi:MAG: hypothetical protein VR70_15780 [Rhodospirillaceae bacterium BRH_c57]|nr:MAG: hypothetical protein VR70_15780 [Rhodospirillaceae bacterium BRH_c57]